MAFSELSLNSGPLLPRIPTGEALHRRPAADERGAVAGLELLEAGAVGDAGDHLAAVDQRLEVARHQPKQLLGVMGRRVGGHRRAGAELAPVEVRHHLAADAQGVGPRPRPGSRPGPETSACICAPPSVSSSESSPVAIFTSGGPPRKHFWTGCG